jgi:hypothetical protein
MHKQADPTDIDANEIQSSILKRRVYLENTLRQFSLVRWHVAVPWLRRLVTGLSLLTSGFGPVPAHVEFVVDEVALGQVFLWVRFLLSIPFHRGFPFLYISWWPQFRDVVSSRQYEQQQQQHFRQSTSEVKRISSCAWRSYAFIQRRFYR